MWGKGFFPLCQIYMGQEADIYDNMNAGKTALFIFEVDVPC